VRAVAWLVSVDADGRPLRAASWPILGQTRPSKPVVEIKRLLLRSVAVLSSESLDELLGVRDPPEE
jgi:hypothetical protein